MQEGSWLCIMIRVSSAISKGLYIIITRAAHWVPAKIHMPVMHVPPPPMPYGPTCPRPLGPCKDTSSTCYRPHCTKLPRPKWAPDLNTQYSSRPRSIHMPVMDALWAVMLQAPHNTVQGLEVSPHPIRTDPIILIPIGLIPGIIHI